MSACLVVAIVGAESTGKSTLALALRDTLAADGTRVACVSEALRDFCDAHARTPRRHEQAGIAAEQVRASKLPRNRMPSSSPIPPR